MKRTAKKTWIREIKGKKTFLFQFHNQTEWMNYSGNIANEKNDGKNLPLKKKPHKPIGRNDNQSWHITLAANS